eukprot:gnl/TRDRNA2_/TRDRNA2_36900_c0_seq1.p1 gnl/TRDRNA2_/TRDRNA2_36900_c0~~gnl/TRDRNA2_/TRDRNA2_36900_c0_seq1.p1  ORF type:complete len:466 (-),score=79.73 gnl/TRDRNA2_/TRDRNA2_36900_c0_seq1:55-1452(-)
MSSSLLKDDEKVGPRFASSLRRVSNQSSKRRSTCSSVTSAPIVVTEPSEASSEEAPTAADAPQAGVGLESLEGMAACAPWLDWAKDRKLSPSKEVVLLLREALQVMCEQLRLQHRHNQLLESQCACYLQQLEEATNGQRHAAVLVEGGSMQSGVVGAGDGVSAKVLTQREAGATPASDEATPKGTPPAATKRMAPLPVKTDQQESSRRDANVAQRSSSASASRAAKRPPASVPCKERGVSFSSTITVADHFTNESDEDSEETSGSEFHCPLSEKEVRRMKEEWHALRKTMFPRRDSRSGSYSSSGRSSFSQNRTSHRRTAVAVSIDSLQMSMDSDSMSPKAKAENRVAFSDTTIEQIDIAPSLSSSSRTSRVSTSSSVASRRPTLRQSQPAMRLAPGLTENGNGAAAAPRRLTLFNGAKGRQRRRSLAASRAGSFAAFEGSSDSHSDDDGANAVQQDSLHRKSTE